MAGSAAEAGGSAEAGKAGETGSAAVAGGSAEASEAGETGNANEVGRSPKWELHSPARTSLMSPISTSKIHLAEAKCVRTVLAGCAIKPTVDAFNLVQQAASFVLLL